MTNDAPDGAFPFLYNGHGRFNPHPNEMTLWTTVNVYDNPEVTNGVETWVKDFRVIDDTANTGLYFLVYQVRNAGDSLSDIFMMESAVWPPVWVSPTELFATGAVKDEFPHVFRTPGGGDWHIFLGEEASGPTSWRILRRSTSDANPRTATWGAAVEVLTGQVAQWDSSGVSGPYIQWWSGTWAAGTFILWYYGQSGDGLWDMHFAVSTTGFDGTYTRTGIGPTVSPLAAAVTTVDGAQVSVTDLNVIDGSVLQVGDPIVTREGQLNAVSAIAANVLTIETKLTIATGLDVEHLCNGAILFRRIRLLTTDTWVAEATVFKVNGGFELSWMYLGIGSDPRTATWSPLRLNDTEIQATIPMVALPYTDVAGYESAENLGFVDLSEMTVLS